jgi:hypothetical protein
VLRTGELLPRAADTDPVRAAAVTSYIDAQLATGRFPHLAKLTRDPAAQAITDPAQADQRFEHGLQALLNGAAAGTSPAPADQASVVKY